MDYKTMSIEELEARQAQIVEEIDNPESNLDELEEEARAIKAELEERKANETKKAEIRSAVAKGEGTVVKEIQKEERTEKTMEEIRNSKEYIDAFARYIKSGDDSECRALLTENVATGTVPVPSIVEGRVRTAWENSGIMDLVRKTFIKGNLKIGFEISATGAVVHTEGGPAVTPEELVLGTVTLVPQSIKKLIQISDEALDMTGQEFLDYIYDELTYQIIKKAEELLFNAIITAPTTPTGQSVSVAEINSPALGIDTVVSALAELNPEASNPVIVTTRANWAAMKASAYNLSYAVDPFEGLPVYFTTQTALGNYALLVGDFGFGAHANFPNGAEIQIKVDETGDMDRDLVNILGRQYVGIGLVADKAFVRVNPSEGA